MVDSILAAVIDSCFPVVFVFDKITNSDLAALQLLQPRSRDVSDDSLSSIREAPGPPGGCAGFYRPVPFPHPPPPEQFLQTQLWLRKRLRLTHCLLNA